MLGGELGGGRQLQLLGLAERALREGREPADRLDLVAEQLQARGAVLGGAEDVQDAAAKRELPARLDLVHPLVARFGQELGAEREVDLLADPEREPLGPKRGVGHRLGQGDGACDDYGRLAVPLARQGVEGGDAKADEVRRRGDVRGVAGASRGVVADAARRQIGSRARARGPGRLTSSGATTTTGPPPSAASSSASAAIRYGWMEPEA